jgi:hypothetical protein
MGWFRQKADVLRQGEPGPLIERSTLAYSRNRSWDVGASPVRSLPTASRTSVDLCESSSGLFKFIVYQMMHGFRRLFVLGFGDVDSAQDRKEQRALNWLH